MKKAFTLIELLVVIAIIAILAAILFPVFAQAKEAAKKTATLSNAKQMGTATAVYTTDSDDTFPLSMSFNSAANTWRVGTIISIPAGWRGGAFAAEPRKTEDSSHWGNAMQPYTKNYGIYEGSGLPDKAVLSPEPGPVTAKSTLTYNGLLHGYNATAVASPSTLPLFWTGNARQNLRGFANSNPMLACTNATPNCRYSPGVHPQTGLAGQGAFFYVPWGCTLVAATDVASGPTSQVHGDGAIWVMSDSSAKYRKMGVQQGTGTNYGPATDYRNDPMTGYLQGAKCPNSYWWDGAYPWLFRPDYQP